MANERYTRTNQKLFFAGLALEQWRKAEADAANQPGQVQAAQEACLFHIYGALLGLCQEVAGFYRTAQADAVAVERILERDAFAQSPSPELGELLEIAEAHGSWIARLLHEYRALFVPAQPPAKVKEPLEELIQAVVLDDREPALTPDEVEGWRRTLKELALRFRQSMTEW